MRVTSLGPYLHPPARPSEPGPTAFLRQARSRAGSRYVFGAEVALDAADPRVFDCSELVQWAAARVGLTVPDGSAAQRAFAIPMPLEEGLRTPGALLFRSGHVAISLGDGRTIEARGRRYGVGVFPARGRFEAAGWIPGLRRG